MKNISLFIIFSICTFQLYSQELTYPQIKGYGGIYQVPESEAILDTNLVYKILVDITENSKNDTIEVNPSLDKLARLINLYVESGIKIENLDIVTIIHFKATPLILSDASYLELFKHTNPNSALLTSLMENNIRFYVCGQSLRARKLVDKSYHPVIKVLKGAIVGITHFQNKGHAYLKL